MSTDRDIYEPERPEANWSWLKPVELFPSPTAGGRIRNSLNLKALRARFNNNKMFYTKTGLGYARSDFPQASTIILNGGKSTKLIIKIA